MPTQIDPILPAERRAAMKAAGLWRDELALDYLDRWVARTPDRLAVVTHRSETGERTALTYGQLGSAVARLAGGLARLGVGKGDTVSYQSANWWEFMALHFALLRIGAISNPLMPIFRERELRFMLGLAESKVFIVPHRLRGFDYQPMAEALKPDLPALEHVLVVGGEGEKAFERLLDGEPPDPALIAARRPDPNDVIEILYTSGTTGEPKGTMHTSNTLVAMLVPYIERLGLGQADVVLMASPIAHQTGFAYGILMPVLFGGTVVLQDVWKASVAADLIAAEGVTFTMGATPFLADLANEAEHRRDDLRTLRIFLSAGAPIPRQLVRRAADNLGAAIISAWGMTENGAVTTTRPDDPPEKAFETDGCPLAGMEIRTVDVNGQVLPPDQEGRLQARGCMNFVGYLKRPQWYAMDAEGWFETGDLARIDADGYMRISGRTKDVIIRGGENIPVVEVEHLIYQHDAVAECALVGMPDPRLGERSCLFVRLREGATLSFAGLTEFLAARGLARTYWPERLEVLEDLPKTPSGKIQKVHLRAMAKEFRANP